MVRCPVQTRYNHRFTTPDMRVLKEPLGELFDEQTKAFKVNLSFGFILKQKVTGRLRYYHSSNNCCGRYMEEPALITNRADFESFQERIQEPDLLNWAVSQRPNSDWICEMVTNVTFFVNKILQHPIGCVDVVLPDYVKRNKAIVGLVKDHYRNATYNDNLCLFRCLALHLKREVDTLHAEYTNTPVHAFVGVTLADLHKVEATFDVNVVVYKLVPTGNEKTKAEIVRRSLCSYVKRNKAIVGLVKDHYRNATYNDNLCLFRCLALHLKREVDTLHAEYTNTPVHAFVGVTLADLHKVEATFDVNVVVYKLVPTGNEKTKAEIVRRSLCSYAQTMYLNLYETHFSYIKDINTYCHSWRCRNCETSLWKNPKDLLRHERTCTEGIKLVYKGGVYHPPSSVFERLDDESIVVGDSLRYYPYRATFDFECYFNDERLPTNTDHVEWIASHVPLSVSMASNVPGYEPAQCYITDGDSDKLVEEMMNNLIAISDAAYDSLLPSYVDVLADLDARKHAWEEETKEAEEEEAENGKKTVNPYKTLEKQLQAWLHQLPVLGFNSGRYDLNAIKKFFVPLLIHNTAERASCFVIKRQNNFMCLSTDKLKFVDICNYLAPGVSYDKYLKAYGCELQKGHFPYEYMDDLQKLEDHVLPPQSVFFSRLKNEGISNDDYARCQAVWRDNGMETMRDYLIWYNNRDVTPFLEAI